MGFVQTPPSLGNQYTDDRVLRSYLASALTADERQAAGPQLERMGALAGGELYRQQLAERELEPVLVQWDAWGNRVDRIETTPLWRRAEAIAAREGLVALAYERPFGERSRVLQFALVYLFTASTEIYACPLAMSDGAARALVVSGNQPLLDRALPRLTSRDPTRFWTSGQWMTEQAGGSDVAPSETVARLEGGGWRLYGRKWFTSAITSQMALTLARPEGNPAGGRGLAMFYLETRDDAGAPNRLTVDRLKDKLGTRKLPTAELTLDGTPAVPVGELANGVRAISTVLNITRTWNSVAALAYMRRGLALARSYAGLRRAFERPLAEQPLHADTLAGLQAEFEASFHLTFRLVELLGRAECGLGRAEDEALLRILTPVVKLTTGRQAVAVVSEVLEAFGGAGYVEDTGLPVLLRDTQVLTIWEGTTNVLSLDTLRALGDGGIAPLARAVERELAGVREPALLAVAGRVRAALGAAGAWLAAHASRDDASREADARRFALTLGRATAAALLASHAQWSLDHEHDRRAVAAAARFGATELDLIASFDPAQSRLLAADR
ncbi:MAG TPA: acyl-CoA dehydrogenase family protein [Gemmatimonadaceae bacterium]